MRLYCVRPYANGNLLYQNRVHRIRAVPGEVLEYDDELAAQLLRDAPDCFHRSPSKTFQRAAGYTDRMMRSQGNVAVVKPDDDEDGDIN